MFYTKKSVFNFLQQRLLMFVSSSTRPRAIFEGPIKGSLSIDRSMHTVKMSFSQLFVAALSISCVLGQNDSSTTLALSDTSETTLTLSTATIPDASNSTIAQKVFDSTGGTTPTELQPILPSTVTILSTDATSVAKRVTDNGSNDVSSSNLVSTDITVLLSTSENQPESTSTTVMLGQKNNQTLNNGAVYSTLEPATTLDVSDTNELKQLSTTEKVFDLIGRTTSSQPILSSTVLPVSDAVSVATTATDNASSDVLSTTAVSTDFTVSSISPESQTESTITTLMVGLKENNTLLNDTVHSTLNPVGTLEVSDNLESNLTDAVSSLTPSFDTVSVDVTWLNSVSTDVTNSSVSSKSQTESTSTTAVIEQKEHDTLINDTVHTTSEPVSTLEVSTDNASTRLSTTSSTSKNLKTTTALPPKKVHPTTTTLSPIPSKKNDHSQSYESNEYHYDRNGVKHSFKHLPDVSQETDVVVIETPYGPVFIPFDKQTIRKIINKNRQVRRGIRRSPWQ